VTTIDAAAAWHNRSPLAMAALAALLSVGLAGCETSNNLLAGNTTTAAPETAVVPNPAATAAAKPQQTRIALAPIIGAPDPVAKQLSGQLTDAIGKQPRIAVAPAGDTADYTVRGYIVAAKEKTSTKVSYIWDVTDPSGKRVNRVTGEEVINGTQNAKDPWSSVTPQLMQTIANRTAGQIAGTLPAGGDQVAAVSGAPTQPPSGAGGPVQTASTASAPVATAPSPAQPAAAPSQQRPQQVASAQPTASIGAGDLRAMVPSVNGAPGDGAQSLSAALQRELSKSGIAVSDRVAPNAYRIEGKVAMGQGREGRQPIQIDWVVKDSQGQRIGTVSQKNEVEAGSLDGPWGQTAEMAAAAAAQGIVKLMQPGAKTTTN
jgi:hypothetical protein